ncbi:hypothetical protein ACO0LG_13385 [Undibacterium sp. Ji42W]|uniref:hypothetical protein n=1 Tax=Undibacterium sp. Ji42W TaxID=3413039 RepID=UPI003BF24B02
MKLSFTKTLITTIIFALGYITNASTAIAANGEIPGWNGPTKEDDQQLRQILTNYVQAFSNGDRVLFESQLLDLNIPFSYIADNINGNKKYDLQSVQKYADFRKSVFESGSKLKQRFSNIKIEQLGSVAQISLDYESAGRDQDYQGKGWKVIQLIKINQQWKIASEFYNGYPDK